MEIKTRAEAKESGLVRYFTGIPCIHLHLCERYVCSGACVECVRHIVKKWEKANPEKVKEKNRKRNKKRVRTGEKYKEQKRKSRAIWRKKYPEKVKEQKRQQKEKLKLEHPEKYKEMKKRQRKNYKKNHPEKYKESLKLLKNKYKKSAKANRRARLRGGAGKVAHGEIKTLTIKQKESCVICLVSFKKSGYHIDHITPLVKGGAHDIKNIQLLCPTCNRRKAAKDPIVFARENGRLL